MASRLLPQFSSKAKLITLAAVAVLLPTTILSVIQYNSLVELERQTKVAVRENFRQTLQNVARQVSDNIKISAKEALLPVGKLHPKPDDLAPVEQYFALVKKTRPEVDRLIFVYTCACKPERVALFYSDEGVRRINDADFKKDEAVRFISESFDRALMTRSWMDMKSPLVFDQPTCAAAAALKGDRLEAPQTLIFYPLMEAETEKINGFAAMTFRPNYVKEHFLSRTIPEVLSCPVEGAPSTEVALAVVDENWKPVYSNHGDAVPDEVKAPFGPVFPRWYLTIGYKNTTIEALAKENFKKSLMLALFVFSFLLLGIVLVLRSTAREMKLAQAKSTFVSNVSHELKTPLALIRLFAETLELGRVRSQEKAQEYYRIINSESRRLTQLINNILDFSKIEAGRKEYEFVESDVAEVVEEVLKSYEYQILNAGFELTTDIQHNLPRVPIDQDAISQAVLNLLNNAVKYSDAVKKIAVSVRARDGHIAIEIADSGIGIPRSEQQKVFEKFYRVSTGLVHNTKGTGLGLALVKHIVEAHRGQIHLESAAGKGSKFTILLPVKASETTHKDFGFETGGYEVAENPNR